MAYKLFQISLFLIAANAQFCNAATSSVLVNLLVGSEAIPGSLTEKAEEYSDSIAYMTYSTDENKLSTLWKSQLGKKNWYWCRSKKDNWTEYETIVNNKNKTAQAKFIHFTNPGKRSLLRITLLNLENKKKVVTEAFDVQRISATLYKVPTEFSMDDIYEQFQVECQITEAKRK